MWPVAQLPVTEQCGENPFYSVLSLIPRKEKTDDSHTPQDESLPIVHFKEPAVGTAQSATDTSLREGIGYEEKVGLMQLIRISRFCMIFLIPCFPGKMV